MRKISTISFAATAIALFALSASQAAVVSVAGDIGDITGQASGQLQILVDIAPENNTFTNGGLALSIGSSQPGVIAFTSATVDNRNIFGADIWSLFGANGLSADGIEDLFAGSVSTQALNQFLPGNPIVDGGTQFLFATIEYDVVGQGTTDIIVGISNRVDPAFSNGQDVSGALEFVGGSVINAVPEPSSMILAGLGLIGFISRRRRS